MNSSKTRWLMLFTLIVLLFEIYLAKAAAAGNATTDVSQVALTACQHLRRAETRRAKVIGKRVRTPRCSKSGEFEEIQCLNRKREQNCYCVDNYGVEIPGTRNISRAMVQCKEPEDCPTSVCRMLCPAGFERDTLTGCIQCRCRDPCAGIECPRGQSCQLVDVKCKSEPCPPLPTCKKARSLAKYCPSGKPLTIDGVSNRNQPFLCGIDEGKPQCPPMHQCLVENGNDYGVCCPTDIKFEKPGLCPAFESEMHSESTGYMCGMPCNSDFECPNMDKCCITKGCQQNCQQPHNITECLKARVVADVMSINEREGRGYIPDCETGSGLFTPRQCSRNGLVCWCVDPRTGYKLQGSMGAANTVQCKHWPKLVNQRRPLPISRSINDNDKLECDTNICAAVCEYGFKNDQNNCPTCECSEPCEGYHCALGSHCVVAMDPLCTSRSTFCSSWPVCQPDISYRNPCEFGVPLTHQDTNATIYCNTENGKLHEFETHYNFNNPQEVTSDSSYTTCPTNYQCINLNGNDKSVCCPNPNLETKLNDNDYHQQSMCEYLRDFSDRMEGTEAGMKLAIAPPVCTVDGRYNERQCSKRKIKVTRAEQRKILEENTIRRMRMLLAINVEGDNAFNESLKTVWTPSNRYKRNIERLKLYRVDDSLLKVRVANPAIGRSAKVIDMNASAQQQGLGQLFATNFKKVIPASKQPINDNELIELEVEECWCVDNFGTEIPRSRGFNVTEEFCKQIRKEIDCLDLTCRMGCEYGFILDEQTRCPACQCRDPCQDVVCSDTEECRVVDVSCDGEYCAPVPACLLRKPGQCPYLVPPGPNNLDVNACAYECRTDSHCDGAKRCCSNGCGTQCVLPQMKTACQHLQSIQLHQSSELGIPARKMHIAQCDIQTGEWNPVQCSPDGYCWCVNANGQELSGTRTNDSTPICEVNSAYECAQPVCNNSCETGYKVNAKGCQTCECRNFCEEINCAANEECQLISVECINIPCPKMPICVPKRESLCPEGSPLKQGGMEVSCGPHNEDEVCPTTHTCQLNPVTNHGVCCLKTRDVCFESINAACLAKQTSMRNVTRYRFSPKTNRCMAITIDLEEQSCPSKNVFENELLCMSVCPSLTQCERLKLKNTLAAHRTGHSSIWFKPRCDPITGHWSPVQCLAKQPDLKTTVNSLATTGHHHSAYGVCWCADKKGAPLKGTLTRDQEPICNSRHGRIYKSINSSDFLMEELIRQMTLLTSLDNDLDEELDSVSNLMHSSSVVDAEVSEASVTESVWKLANSLIDSQTNRAENLQRLQITTTRCRSLVETATFPVSCDENGAFTPTQCNQKYCWCVDSAGNQLESSIMFEKGSNICTPTPISSVLVELFMQNTTSEPLHHINEIIRQNLYQLLGNNMENLQIVEQPDGSILIRFELRNEKKIDLAFAIESSILNHEFQLANGLYSTDITRSQFVHKRYETKPIYAKVVSHEGSIQLALFITASGTAILICLFVVYVMIKRNQAKHRCHPPIFPYQSRKTSLNNDADFPSPIFVLSPEHDLESIRAPVPPTSKRS